VIVEIRVVGLSRAFRSRIRTLEPPVHNSIPSPSQPFDFRHPHSPSLTHQPRATDDQHYHLPRGGYWDFSGEQHMANVATLEELQLLSKEPEVYEREPISFPSPIVKSSASDALRSLQHQSHHLAVPGSPAVLLHQGGSAAVYPIDTSGTSAPGTPIHGHYYASPLAYSSPMAAAPAASPALQTQLMQMQNQMALLSQSIAMNAGANSAANNARPAAADSMMCFSLGERLGALHKHEELTKDELRDLQQTLHETVNGLGELRARHAVLEANLEFCKSSTTQMKSQQDKLVDHANDTTSSLVALGKDREHDRETSVRAQQALEKSVKHVASQLASVTQSTSDLMAQTREIANEQKHHEAEQRQLKKTNEAVRAELTSTLSRLQAAELRLERDREERDRLHAGMAERVSALDHELSESSARLEANWQRELAGANSRLERSLATLQRELRDAMQQQQQQMSAFQQQHQSQLLLLQTQQQQQFGGLASSLSIGTGLLSLLLQSLLPFLPYDRVQSIAAYCGSWCHALQTSPQMRTIWALLLAGDISLRVLDHFAPVLSRILVRLVGLDSLSPLTRLALRIVRLSLELGLLVQLAVAIGEWTRSLLHRARDSIQENYSDAKSSITKVATRTTLVLAPTLLVAGLYRYREQVFQGAAPVVERLQQQIQPTKRVLEWLRTADVLGAAATLLSVVPGIASSSPSPPVVVVDSTVISVPDGCAAAAATSGGTSVV